MTLKKIRSVVISIESNLINKKSLCHHANSVKIHLKLLMMTELSTKKWMFSNRRSARTAGCRGVLCSETTVHFIKHSHPSVKNRCFQCTTQKKDMWFMIKKNGGKVTGIHSSMDKHLILIKHSSSNSKNFKRECLDSTSLTLILKIVIM